MTTQINEVRRLALFLQVVGFAALAVVSWLDEAIDLPHLLFRARPTPFRPEEAAFETLLLALVAGGVVYLTNVILRRLAYVESFLAFCPSCQRVQRRGEWTSISDYFQEQEAGALQHGLCPDCAGPGRGGAEGRSVERRSTPRERPS